MSGGGSTNTIQNADPWSGQQPYLANIFQNTGNTYQQLGTNPEQTVAGFSPMQTEAQGLTQGIAGGSQFGAPQVNNTAQGAGTQIMAGADKFSNPGYSPFAQLGSGTDPGSMSLRNFAGGGMFGSNPYTQATANAMTDPIVRAYQTATSPQTDAQFAAAGRYGSGAWGNAVNQNQQNLTAQLGNAVSPLYQHMYDTNTGQMLAGAQGLSSNMATGAQGMGNLYDSAAGRQMQAIGMAPQLSGLDWSTISQLNNMGGQQQALQQQVNQAPWTQLGNYNNLIRGSVGGTTNTQQPYFSNTLSQLIGGAAGAYGLYNMLAGLGSAAGEGAAVAAV
jgi:hypothetical protein